MSEIIGNCTVDYYVTIDSKTYVTHSLPGLIAIVKKMQPELDILPVTKLTTTPDNENVEQFCFISKSAKSLYGYHIPSNYAYVNPDFSGLTCEYNVRKFFNYTGEYEPNDFKIVLTIHNYLEQRTTYDAFNTLTLDQLRGILFDENGKSKFSPYAHVNLHRTESGSDMGCSFLLTDKLRKSADIREQLNDTKTIIEESPCLTNTKTGLEITEFSENEYAFVVESKEQDGQRHIKIKNLSSQLDPVVLGNKFCPIWDAQQHRIQTQLLNKEQQTLGVYPQLLLVLQGREQYS